jgi:hypothetical protein
MATCVAALAAASCGAFRSMAPWRSQPEHPEVNLAFTLEKNLVVMQSVSVDGKRGRFLLGSATPQTVLDPKLRPGSGPHAVQLSTRDSVRFTPVAADMHGIADGILGADVWGNHAVSIDYFAGLVTYQKDGGHHDLMAVYPFAGEPAVQVSVDGETIDAIVDTTSPDTLTLPRASKRPSRAKARITLAGADFGEVDVRYADVAAPRIGNRLLSHFLVSIDYGRRVIGLWRDPRFG